MRRKIKTWDKCQRQQRIKELEEAAQPPKCKYCGEEAFFHLCPNLEEGLRLEEEMKKLRGE